ncbi:MAG: hypothetical protein H8E31_06190 [Planctomycetes bacterium]|nr:hypothetical protein [Planctomycetota bacterium]
MTFRFFALLLLFYAAACAPADEPARSDPVEWTTAWIDSLEEAAAADGEPGSSGAGGAAPESTLRNLIEAVLPPETGSDDRDPRALANETSLLRLATLRGFLRRDIQLANRFVVAGVDRAQVSVFYSRGWILQEREGHDLLATMERAFLLGLICAENRWQVESFIIDGSAAPVLLEQAELWQSQEQPRRLKEEVVEVRLRRRRPGGSVYFECLGETAGPGEFTPGMEAAIQRGAELRFVLDPAVQPPEFQPWWPRFEPIGQDTFEAFRNSLIALQKREDGTIWSAGRSILLQDPARPPTANGYIDFDEGLSRKGGLVRVVFFGWQGIDGAALAPVIEAWFRAGGRSFARANVPPAIPFDPRASPVDQVAWLVDAADRALQRHLWEHETAFLSAGWEKSGIGGGPMSMTLGTPSASRSFQAAIAPLISGSLALEEAPVEFTRVASPQPVPGVFPSSILLREFRMSGDDFGTELGWSRSIWSHEIGFPPDPDRLGVRLDLNHGHWISGRPGSFCFHFRKEEDGWRIDQLPEFGSCDRVFQLERDPLDRRVWSVRRDGMDSPTTAERAVLLEVVEAGTLVPDPAHYSRGRLKMREGRRVRFVDGPELTATGDELRAFLGVDAATTRFELQLPDDASYQDVISAIDVLFTAGVVRVELRLPVD